MIFKGTHLFALVLEELLVELRIDRLHSVLEKEFTEDIGPETGKAELLHVGAVIELIEHLQNELLLFIRIQTRIGTRIAGHSTRLAHLTGRHRSSGQLAAPQGDAP